MHSSVAYPGGENLTLGTRTVWQGSIPSGHPKRGLYCSSTPRDPTTEQWYVFYMEGGQWHEGGCFCSNVRYRVCGDAVWKAGCTCRTCVKMHAAPYVVWAGFDRANFEITRGRLKEYRSSAHVVRAFCPTCGSALTYRKDAAGVQELEAAARLVYIAVASLDDPEPFPPDEIVHGQEKISWIHFGSEVPVRAFISETAGDLQFGGIDPELADELAKRHFGANQPKD